MKISKYILISLSLVLILGISACTDLDVDPVNIVQEKEIYGSENGVKSYLARMYSQTPIEDFRYSRRGMNDFWLVNPVPAMTGEALSRDLTSASTENFDYWGDAYKIIREVNSFLETLPKYQISSSFSQTQVEIWLGEAYFIRAFTYYALAKRYGGVPLVDAVLSYPEQEISALQIPRSSEQAVFDKIAEDLDKAYNLLPEANQVGRSSKYAAAGLKSRAMLFAGSIAKYNTISRFDSDNNRLCGIPADKANYYFELSYKAAILVDASPNISLYMNDWKAGDKEAQYQNYVNLFLAENSPENILVRQYGYPEYTHGYDVYNIPRQFMVGGYSAEINPTLEFVEMFDGLPKKANGKINVYDATGKYNLYPNQMDFFANAEPRLRSSVILPGDAFKDIKVEIWRGVYTGNSAGGISPLIPVGSKDRYENTSAGSVLITSATPETQQIVTLNDGSMMNAAGRSGCFYGDGGGALTGFSVRKWMNPKMPAAEVVEHRSDQDWIEMRYAEILLNKAEAAYELYLAGVTITGVDLQEEAFQAIDQIQNRAGADRLSNKSALTLDIIRKERRKELAFENKIWWDLRRWRILDQEQNGTNYRALMSFYAKDVDKWFFDDRYEERNFTFTVDSKWYYKNIPSGEISKSPNLVQNPGY